MTTMTIINATMGKKALLTKDGLHFIPYNEDHAIHTNTRKVWDEWGVGLETYITRNTPLPPPSPSQVILVSDFVKSLNKDRNDLIVADGTLGEYKTFLPKEKGIRKVGYFAWLPYHARL